MKYKNPISGIYTVTNLINGKIYVGYSNNLQLRESQHFSSLKLKYHGNEHLQNAFLKYGIENLKFEILEECPEEYLCSQEHYWAIVLNTHNPDFGYNIKPTNPNGRNVTHSQATKDKISKANKGGKGTLGRKMSEKNKEALKLANMGKPHPMKGKVRSEEFKQKVRIARAKQSPPTLGYKQSPETIAKRMVNIKKPVYQYNMDWGFIKEWDSISEAARALHIDASNIVDCLKNPNHSIKKNKWRYKN